MVWGGGGGGVAAAVNAAAAAVASGQAEHVIVYRGLTEADHGRQSYGRDTSRRCCRPTGC
jgi:hypothetical protein